MTLSPSVFTSVMVHCHHFVLLISLFVSDFVYYEANSSKLSTVCLKSCTMTQFTLPEIWKRAVVLLSIHTEAPIRRFHNVLRSIRGYWKEFENSSMISIEIKKVQRQNKKPHSDRSDEKITPEILEEIQTMIENDTSNSIWSIARDMGVSEFLIRYVSQ